MSLRDPDHAAVYSWLRQVEAGRAPASTKALSPGSGVPYPGSGSGSGGTAWWGSVAGGRGLRGGDTPGADADYRRMAGRLDGCAVVAICLRWITTNFLQAKLQVTVPGAKGRPEPVPDHAFTRFMRRPCPPSSPGSRKPIYSARSLWSATLIDLLVSAQGEAFWAKVREGGPGGPVSAVKWIPGVNLRPVVPRGQVTDTYIDQYEYHVGSYSRLLPADDVVHFRTGVGLDDVRAGWSALGAGLRQVATLNGGATMRAAWVRNLGIPPVVFTGLPGLPLEDAERFALVEEYQDATSGENAGRALAFRYPVGVERLGLSPADMALDVLLNGPASEVCALLGLRPLTVGLSDDRGTYENEGQARTIGWEDCLVPLGDMMIEDGLQDQLLDDFGDAEAETLSWDRSDIPAMQGDAQKKIDMAVAAFQARIISFNQAAEAAGWEPRDGGEDVYWGDVYPWSAPAPEPDPADDPAETQDDGSTLQDLLAARNGTAPN